MSAKRWPSKISCAIDLVWRIYLICTAVGAMAGLLNCAAADLISGSSGVAGRIAVLVPFVIIFCAVASVPCALFGTLAVVVLSRSLAFESQTTWIAVGTSFGAWIILLTMLAVGGASASWILWATALPAGSIAGGLSGWVASRRVRVPCRPPMTTRCG